MTLLFWRHFSLIVAVFVIVSLTWPSYFNHYGFGLSFFAPAYSVSIYDSIYSSIVSSIVLCIRRELQSVASCKAFKANLHTRKQMAYKHIYLHMYVCMYVNRFSWRMNVVTNDSQSHIHAEADTLAGSWKLEDDKGYWRGTARRISCLDCHTHIAT